MSVKRILLLCLTSYFVFGSVTATMSLLVLFVFISSYGDLVLHPSEIKYVVYYLFSKTPQIPSNISENQKFCYEKLIKVSRSFSAVILSINEELREPICLFYLVCRGLDTIEDDMKHDVVDKENKLRTFHTHLRERGWNLKGHGDKKDEIELLEQFDKVIDRLLEIKPKYLDIIEDVAKEMGNGMADFLSKKVVTIKDYNLYCWYVAGLVGEGLSKLFVASNLEDNERFTNEKLYTAMGLFLQKTNITRDYLDDINQKPPRIFYPKDIWSKYVPDVTDLKNPKYTLQAVQCLNEMITDAITHAVDCLDYLDMIKDPTIFKFCAIPQVMAIATLYECYNNPNVFKTEVKIRKTLALKMIMDSNTIESVRDYFQYFSHKIRNAIPNNDPNKLRLQNILNDLDNRLHKNGNKK